jgi:hypothetical protein
LKLRTLKSQNSSQPRQSRLLWLPLDWLQNWIYDVISN